MEWYLHRIKEISSPLAALKGLKVQLNMLNGLANGSRVALRDPVLKHRGKWYCSAPHEGRGAAAFWPLSTAVTEDGDEMMNRKKILTLDMSSS